LEESSGIEWAGTSTILPGRVLALRYWICEVEPTSGASSRLHVRTRAAKATVPLAPLIARVFEPVHFIMERKMLLSITSRAEGKHSAMLSVQ
jgi:hypothetical protein